MKNLQADCRIALIKVTPNTDNVCSSPACVLFLRKMEGALSFLNSNTELLTENLHTAIVGHLEIIDAGHDTWKIVI